jgi:DNA processing protein
MSRIHWLAFNSITGVGGVTARRLIERFGSIEAAFAAPDEELLAVPRFTAGMVARLRGIRLEALESELAELADEGLQVLTWDDEGYPANLRQVSDAPPLLFVRGALRSSDADAVAIVGTRQPSPEGAALAGWLARELAWRRLTVVSGLALGIDTAVHCGALAAPGGRTLAVPGSGLRTVHPRANAPLAEAIAGRGALLSELRPDTPPSGPGLMARDRIQSGLSRAVIVVEAAERGGSVDTAARARRQGRLLFAVAGSPGTDLLLAGGAEPLDPETADLDALVERIRRYEPGGGEPQLGLWE